MERSIGQAPDHQALLADAEAGEDGGEDGGGGDVAEDGGEVGDGLAEVEGDEVAGEAGGETVDDARGAFDCAGKGFGMSSVGDEDAFGGVAGFCCGTADEGVAEGVKSKTGEGRYGDDRCVGGQAGRQCRGAVGYVGFVQNGYEVSRYFLLGAGSDGGGNGFGVGHCCRVNDEQGNARAAYGASSALDALLFDGVGGVAQTCCVDKSELVVADCHGFFDCVARGAVNVGYYGALFAEKGVEQG